MNIDLDDQFIKKFFELTDKMLPDGQQITPVMMKNQLLELEETIKEAKDNEKELEELREKVQKQKTHFQSGGAVEEETEVSESSGDDEEETFNVPKKNILVIDDLGVITYQIGVLLKNNGYQTTESREIYDAIEKFKKQRFDLVIMDLFIPTEREGFILLEELKKIAVNKSQKVKIGIMSASGKKEHKQLCKMKGSDFYVEKIDNWQKELLSVINNLFK